MSTFLSLMEVFCIASSKGNLLINEQIKANQVLVIGPNGEQVGVKSLSDALTLSSYAGLDLVLISPNANPPVCKVMDYNKYKYEKSKKEKEALKRQKANMSELKEFRLSPVIDVGDFETKLKQVTKYLQKGDKIKLSIRFKGRQMAHTELGKEVKQGDVIMAVGSTGNSTGPHLHFEVRIEGKTVDPIPYLDGTVSKLKDEYSNDYD